VTGMGGATSQARVRATYADIEALPAHVKGELIAGELVVHPRPAPRHAGATSGLGALISGPFRFGVGGPGGWWIIDEPELHLADDVLVPDLAGWRLERLPDLPETAFFALAPDWVCEVLSPSTERLDRDEKSALYAREGVRHLWLLNPALRLLEVHRLEAGRWVIVARHGKEESGVRIEPFDAVPLDLHLLWSRPAAPG
jgi:Uma2 family endonuclease